MRLCTVLLLWLAACDSSLTYYGDKGPDGVDPTDPTGTTPTDTITTVTTTTTTTTTSTDATTQPVGDADTDTDADTDADADADADSDADTDTGALPAVMDGTYEGTITIEYDLTFPPVHATCTGDVTLTVDQLAPQHVVGTLDCEWPLLSPAQLTVGDVDGQIAGMVAGLLAGGDSIGDSTEGLLSWSNESWDGSASGTTITGSSNWGFALIGAVDLSFTANRTGP